MIHSMCGLWRIEWGPGSIRPDHYILYHCGPGEEYVGSYLTLPAAMQEARRWGGQAIDDARAVEIIWGYSALSGAMQVASEHNNAPGNER